MKQRTSLVFSDTFTMAKMKSKTIFTRTLQNNMHPNNRFLRAFRFKVSVYQKSLKKFKKFQTFFHPSPQIKEKTLNNTFILINGH